MNDALPIEAALCALDNPKRVAFCAALAERQLPNFRLFSELTEFGDATKLANVLDGIWQALAPGGAQMNFATQQDKVEEQMPDLEQFDMYGTKPAHDAVVCLYSTLGCLLEKDPAEAVAVGLVSREVVASFIEVTEADDEMSDEDVLRMIAIHPLMEQEDDFQSQLIEQLSGKADLDKALLKQLRELARNEGVSNIGISSEG